MKLQIAVSALALLSSVAFQSSAYAETTVFDTEANKCLAALNADLDKLLKANIEVDRKFITKGLENDGAFQFMQGQISASALAIRALYEQACDARGNASAYAAQMVK